MTTHAAHLRSVSVEGGSNTYLGDRVASALPRLLSVSWLDVVSAYGVMPTREVCHAYSVDLTNTRT